MEFGGKNVGESRDEMVFAKSVGVTSETNHGNSFGLVNVVSGHDRFKVRISRQRTGTRLERSMECK